MPVTPVNSRKTPKPKVTVYIVSRNYGKFLCEAIESVLRQTYSDWELLLVNDGSSDNTVEVMERYKSDKRIRLFNTQGLGLTKVSNIALDNAKGDYFIRLDADDVFDENILLVLSNCLDKNPRLVLVFPDYFLMDETGYIYAQKRREPIYFKNHMLDIPPNGACTMIRKKILQDVGGYREDLGAQDGFDLWAKIHKKFKCANVNIPLFYYRQHGKNLTGNTKYILTIKREIKKDFSLLSIDKYRPITAIIPCRCNYDCCVDLWNQKIDDKTLLDIALQKCIKSKLFDKIVVASDNPKTKNVLKKYGDNRITYHERSPASTIRSRSIIYTLDDVVQRVDSPFSGTSVMFVIQAPFITTETIEEAIYTLVLNDADSSILVGEIDAPLFERTPHGLMQINYKGFLVSDFDTIYLDTRTCLVTRNSNLKRGSLTGSKIVSITVPRDETFYISRQIDLEIADFLFRKRRK